MTERTHDELAELLGAYALDAVDGDERDAVDAHLATCPRCRAEVAEHREVAALLAHAGAPAPEGLWDRIAGALDTPPPALTLAPVPSAPTPTAPARPDRRLWARPVTAALAAAAVLVIAVLGIEVYRLDQRLDDQSVAMVEQGLRQEFLAAKEAPGSLRTELSSADEGLTVEVVVAADGRGYLKSEALPELPEGRTYQLWGDIGNGELISLGVLGGEPREIFTFTANARLAGLAITDETAPGVVTSAQPAVVAGELS